MSLTSIYHDAMNFLKRVLNFAVGLVTVVVLFLIFTLPATFLLMLFFGNAGFTHLGYWETFPLGILVAILLAGVTNNK